MGGKNENEGRSEVTALAMPPDDVLQTANAVRRSVASIARRFRGLRLDHGVSAARLSLLGHLYRVGQPMAAADLARIERLRPQSLTRLIADLEVRALIKRRHDEADRRLLLIEITKKGRDLLVLDARQQTVWLARTMQKRLSPTEQEMLRVMTAVLDRLAIEDV
jgi:DNA-binding MarR family transcriptional regulator